MACFTTWTVLPHQPIQKATENFWWVEGTMPKGFSRKMSVLRLGDGSVMVHNAIALEEPAMQELEAFFPADPDTADFLRATPASQADRIL